MWIVLRSAAVSLMELVGVGAVLGLGALLAFARLRRAGAENKGMEHL
jgi:hypothetical protein